MQVSRELLRAVGRAARRVGELRRVLIEAVGGAASGFHYVPDKNRPSNQVAAPVSCWPSQFPEGRSAALKKNLRSTPNADTRALCVLPFGHKEANMDNTTLLIIIILVVILLGGGWYGRGRWF
jgi:hypothetical protein